MKDTVTPILDAAERRMRIGGLSAFSHREIAADVGVKSSSVHYHFPTKDNLAAAVIRRYRERVSLNFDAAIDRTGGDAATVLKQAFRGTLHSEGRMCPCALLGAAAFGLPEEVKAEVKNFWQMSLGKLTRAGMSATAASEFLATITGAMVMTAALGDLSVFDQATGELQPHRDVA